MSIITIDFETYYDKDYSLSKMTTEEYINDPRFEVIGVGIKEDDGEPVWHTETEFLKNLAWEDHAILCHNTMFDGAILAWKYGIKPGFWFDTLCMARAIHGVDAGGSLKALASRYNLGEKGDEVVNAIGKRRSDFAAQDLKKYGAYCINDCNLTYSLFHKLNSTCPDSELQLIDLTIRMYTEPSLMVDDALLVQRLVQVRAEKSVMLSALMQVLECDTEEAVRKKLASNQQFAQLLENLNVKIPMKVSKTTGKEALALAKTDDGFLALQEHEEPLVQQLCAVRLGTKSTLEESRIERFIKIGGRNRNYIPVPLKFYGAHTGRWSGMDSINFQNLPSRDKAKKTLKNAIVAPPGHVIINCDSSQIEARVLAWWAGQTDVVEQFASGEDVYCTFATKAYGRTISEADPIERFVGKTCILGLGYGTGAAKLQQTLKLGGADLDLDECRRIVNLYRQESSRIPTLWKECDMALQQMMSGEVRRSPLGCTGVHYDATGIQLPNGLYIRYPNLRSRDDKPVYDSRKGPVNIWGGAVVENVVQALARIIVGQQMLAISERYRVALTVHDAAVIVVNKTELDDALAFVIKVMSTPPEWAAGLPVACKAKYGNSYGEC